MSVSTEKISVIMPVYNTPEKYIQVSVDSVLKQTYRNIELIIVDDGSERACAEYCDTLAQKDIRIKVIHKNNSGVSSARNIGTESATGSYVMYMDSDDILKNTAIQQGVRVIAKTEADFVFAGLQHISDYNSFLSRQDNNREVLEFTLYQEEEIDKIRRAFLALRDKDFLNIRGKGFVNRGPYARLIKKDIATKVKFNERLKIGEDVEWNMRLLNECSIVCFIKSIWYGYLIYQNSSLRKYYGNRSKLLEEYHRTLYKQNRAFCAYFLFLPILEKAGKRTAIPLISSPLLPLPQTCVHPPADSAHTEDHRESCNPTPQESLSAPDARPSSTPA